jgi:hypothetical protein
MRSVRLTATALAVLAAVLAPIPIQRGGGDDALGPAVAVAQTAALNVPRADCGPNDRVETGLQGQTTLAERLSGASEEAYNCNLELVGQFGGEGASWQFAWFDDCGYYDTANNPAQQHRGVVVVDASDPSNPQATAYLADRAMLDPWESLKVNKRRKLLGATKGPGGPNDRYFSFYDISDCAHPKLLADVEVAGHIGHAGGFAPDGLTYYGTSLNNPGHLTAMDISDPTNPKVVAISRQFIFHDISISDNGTRLYAAQAGHSTGNLTQQNGLMILDVSDIQYRRSNPQFRVIGSLFWEDGAVAQMTQPVKIKGRPYLIFVDERGSGRAHGGGREGWAMACSMGLPPFGFARIIDISDETRPKTISKLMLEVHDPANCSLVLDDNPQASFAYDSHYCTVDNPNNAKLVGCGYFGSGLRVFDIRDPYHPKEIAYYKPPARRTEVRLGSNWWPRLPDRTIDWASSNVRFFRHKGDLQIWFTSQDNGFQIVRFTNRLMALTGLEFDQDHPGNRN